MVIAAFKKEIKMKHTEMTVCQRVSIRHSQEKAQVFVQVLSLWRLQPAVVSTNILWLMSHNF